MEILAQRENEYINDTLKFYLFKNFYLIMKKYLYFLNNYQQKKNVPKYGLQ